MERPRLSDLLGASGADVARVAGVHAEATEDGGSELVAVEMQFRAAATGTHALACLQRPPIQPGSAFAFTARAALARRLSAWQVVIDPPRPLQF